MAHKDNFYTIIPSIAYTIHWVILLLSVLCAGCDEVYIVRGEQYTNDNNNSICSSFHSTAAAAVVAYPWTHIVTKLLFQAYTINWVMLLIIQ